MYHSPVDLAELLDEALKARGRPSPGSQVLRELCETMYAASLRTEEGEGITFHIAFADPADPDPDPPRRIRSHRWRSAELGERLPFTVEQLTKLAKASDPRTSSLATYHDDGGLFVWGLIDQGNRYFEYLNYDAESTQAYRPGSFQASIEGPAHLIAWMDFEKIAELRGAELAGTALDALEQGPLRDALEPGLSELVAATRARQQEHDDSHGNTKDATVTYGPDEEVDLMVARSCVEALKRILIRAQNYGHGGAILIAPDPPGDDLNVKYVLDYPRLRDALVNMGAHRLDWAAYSDMVHELLDEKLDALPMGLYLEEAIAEDEVTDGRDEIEGVVWFISLLTRVDGLVLLTPDFRVAGFGVEIRVRQEPDAVVLAEDATLAAVSELDPTRYGTRHRSMMRYCAQHPGSIGFVISQDGAIRGLTRVGDATVMWNNVKIQQHRLPEGEHDPSGQHDERDAAKGAE